MGIGADGGAIGGSNGNGGSRIDGGGALSTEESVEAVEPEEAWLSSLGRQVVAGSSRWPSAIAKAKESAKATKVCAVRVYAHGRHPALCGISGDSLV